MTSSRQHFFIVGGQRCGTTYLCHLMDEHPEIEMARPFRPEPKHFLQEVTATDGRDRYESSFFGKKPGARLYGEKSTSYMESSAAARRIAEWYPSAKIVFVLRNPVDRAISHYWFSVKNGLETLPMTEAFLSEEVRRDSFDVRQVSVSPFAYLSRGRYGDAISMYEEFFPRESILVVLYEEMVATLSPVQKLFGALGVDRHFSPSAHGRRINEGEYGSRGLPGELTEYLEAYFADSNARLSARIGKDLATTWKIGTSGAGDAGAVPSSTLA